MHFANSLSLMANFFLSPLPNISILPFNFSVLFTMCGELEASMSLKLIATIMLFCTETKAYRADIYPVYIKYAFN